MTKDDIKKIYTNKIKELNKHNNLYYEKSKPIISDAKFALQYNKHKIKVPKIFCIYNMSSRSSFSSLLTSAVFCFLIFL